MNPTSRAREEDGAVLVLVLVFLGAFGLLAAALLAQGDVNFRSTSALKVHESKVYAADAGIEHGVNTLKAETQWCPDPTYGTMNLPSTTVNGITVDVTCQTQSGNGAGSYGYAIITHDPGASSISASAGADKQITGAIYNSGGWNLQQPVFVQNGTVFQSSAATGGCGTQDTNLTISPSPPYKWVCTNGAAPIPDHALPSSIPTIASIPTVNNSSGGCTTLHPGTYNAATFAIQQWIAKGFTSGTSLFNGPTYMESGVYYFDNVGTISMNGNSTVVFGGAPAAGDTKQLSATSCGSDPGGTTDTGVLIILGGNSTISVDQGAQVELFTHTATSGGATNGISLYQVPSGTTGGWSATSLAKAANFLDVSGNASTIGAVHGAIYGPEGSISVFSSNAASAALSGGSDVWDFSMKSSQSNAGRLIISSIANTPGQRQIVVTATARGGVSGDKDIVSRAVITIDNSITPRQASILSWWTDNR